MRVRQGLQEYAFQNAKNSRIGTDTESQGEDGDKGEHRCAAQAMEDLLELTGERTHEASYEGRGREDPLISRCDTEIFGADT